MSGADLSDRGQCLSDECLTDYLEGNLDSVVKGAYEAHLIVCDNCRANLALFMKVMNDETSPEEDTALQQLTAMLDERKLRPADPVVPSRRWIYGVAAAALLIVSVLAGLLWHFGSRQSRAEQITEVFLERSRPFEPRIVNQPYLPIQEVTRSPEETRVSGVLEEEMAKQTAEDYAVGRFFLLQRKYPEAIKFLRSAVADPKGVPADVYSDLGVAYLENKNFAEAESQFKDALSRNSGHLPALFNLSILYKRQGRLGEAKEWGERYLARDSSSDWAKEVRARLSGKDSAGK